MADEHIRTTLYFPVGLHRRLRQRAHEADTSMSQLVETYCWDGLVRDELAARDREGPGTTSPAAGPSELTE